MSLCCLVKENAKQSIVDVLLFFVVLQHLGGKCNSSIKLHNMFFFHEAMCEQLPYLRSLGIGALILEGLFDEEPAPSNLNLTHADFGTLPQIKHLIAASNKTGKFSESKE